METFAPFVDLRAQYECIRTEVDAAIHRVLESTHFVGGPQLAAFEEEFAAFVGARYCVGVANGTEAITLALKAAGIGRGDEVLVPANSFFASAEAVSNANAVPIFVDVDPMTFHMSLVRAEEAITSRTRAIIPVHLYGLAMDLSGFETLAASRNLVMIEDCAQAHGAEIHGKVIGSSGRLTCYSFYPGKNLGAYGDGGAVTTSDPDLEARLRMLRDHGSLVKYEHRVIGTNSRLDSLQAAVLSVKLRYLPQWNDARRRHARKYAAALEDSSIIPPAIPEGNQHVFHLFVVRCSRRDKLKHFLEEKGIQTGVHYPFPLHLTEAYQALGAPGSGSKPIAEMLAGEILSLPIYPELSERQIEHVILALQGFVLRERLAPVAELHGARQIDRRPHSRP
jgi:dTDP-4-amino-4,6-dideoxygalactose transaminase